MPHFLTHTVGNKIPLKRFSIEEIKSKKETIDANPEPILKPNSIPWRPKKYNSFFVDGKVLLLQ